MNSSHPDWKGCPPRVTSIAIVNDDEGESRALAESIKRDFPLLSIETYETLFELYQGIRCFDYIICDISAVTPDMLNPARAYAPIAKFMSEYVRPDFIITSAIGRESCQEVIDEIVKALPEAAPRLHYGGYGGYERGVKAKLHELIKPEDCVWTKVKSKKRA